MSDRYAEQLNTLSPEEKRALLTRLRASQVQKPKAAPLSLAQERLFALCQIEPRSPGYNITTAYRLDGPLEAAVLEQALNQLIRRHAILRTAFATVDGQPVQLIAPDTALRVEQHDLAGTPPAEQEQHLRQIMLQQGHHVFNLRQAPLLRASLIRLGAGQHALILTTHRLVFDGQCWPVLIAELSAHCQTASGTPTHLPELPLQYADFAAWQRRSLVDGALDAQLDYWREHLSGRLPLLRLPLDHPRSSAQSRSELRTFRLPAHISEALARLSRQEGVSLFVCLLAAFQVLLHDWSAQDDFVVFTSVAGRNRPELKGLIGLFANILALRADLSGRPTFRELLDRARASAAGAYAHQDVPFEQILELVRFERDQPFASIFQVLFVLWPEPVPPLEWPGMTLQPLDLDIKPAEFDLLLHVTHTRPEMTGMLRYKADLFEAATITRLLARFQQLLAAAVADPDQRVADLPRAGGAAEQGLVTGAVSILPSQWSYLRAPERWINMVEMVAIQPPPDPALMAQAVQHLVAHHDALRTRFAHDGQWHQHLAAPGAAPPLSSVDLAHVPTEQREGAITARLAALQPRLGPLGDTLFHVTLFQQGADQPSYLVFTVHHSICDNASLPLLLEDLHTAYRQLARGAAVRLPPKTTSVKTWAALMDAYLRSEEFQQRLAAELALLLPPGPPLPIDDPAGRSRNTLASTAQVQAALGAEDTQLLLKEFPRAHQVWPRDILLAGLAQTLTDWSGGNRVTLQIVDTGRHLDLPGVGDIDLARTVGCLFVPCILTLERPTATDPLDALHQMHAQISRYPTYGTAAGVAQQSGASDAIPPAEMRLNYLGQATFPELSGWAPYTATAIEEVIATRRHADIDRSPVLLNCTAIILQGQLVMRWEYSTSLHQHTTVEQLANAFAATLQTLAQAERRRRDNAGPDTATRASAYVAPRTPQEALLADIWAKALDHARVGIHDNFFELGGDSITGLRIIAKANHAGLQLAPNDLFQHQTIAELAALSTLESARTPRAAAGETLSGQPILAEQGLVAGELPLTPNQSWYLSQNPLDPNQWNMTMLCHVTQPLNHAWLRQAAAALLLHHDALRIRFAREGAGWRQYIADSDVTVPIHTIDLADLPAHEQMRQLNARATEIQHNLNIITGPLISMAYFEFGPQQPGRLLVVMHHLLGDIFSLYILLEDLELAYQQISAGRPPQFLPKTTSYKQWATFLAEYAQSVNWDAELHYWLTTPWKSAPPLPVDYPERLAENTLGSSRTHTVALSAPETHALLHKLPQHYQAQVLDILLAALGETFTRWTNSRTLLTSLIINGRETIFDSIDLSRTVGMFANGLPLLLDFSAADSLRDMVAAAKAQLGRIPNRGMSYSILYRLCGPEITAKMDAGVPVAELVFNYAGRLPAGSALFQSHLEVVEPTEGLHNQRSLLIQVTAFVFEQQLLINWDYSQNLYAQATIARLAQYFLDALRELISEISR